MADYATREEMLAAFGPFSVVFKRMGEDRSPYLCLLHLHDERSLNVIRAIRDAARDSQADSCIQVMLSDVNWRPHLVGAVAVFYRTSNESLDQMWAALDSGSWVTPQLAGMLFRCDPDFAEKAISRLEALCRLSADPEYAIESATLRHSAQGPAGNRHRSAKSAASLYALLAREPQGEAYSRLAENEPLQQLIGDDYDDSADIATTWLTSFDEWKNQI